MVITIGDLEVNNINTKEKLERYLKDNGFSDVDIMRFVDNFKRLIFILTESLKDLKFQLDIPDGMTLTDKINTLNNFLNDPEEKITKSTPLSEVLEINKWFSNLKRKSFFREKE